MHAYNVVWSYVHNGSVYLFPLGQSVSPLTSYPLFKTITAYNIVSLLSGAHVSISLGPSTVDE